MNFEIQPVVLPQDVAAWDRFVEASPMGTFLHTQRFLSYHGNRFTDASLWILSADEPVGLLPAAISLAADKRVISHPGLTFGGLLHQGNLKGEAMIAALQAVLAYYRAQGLEALCYKAIPAMYHPWPQQDDSYALFRLGAIRTRCDLSATVDVPNRPPWNKKRIKNMKQVEKQGITCRTGFEELPVFWPILEARLEAVHQSKPVHSLDEISMLAERFPDFIQCWVGYQNEEPVGGTVVFNHVQQGIHTVVHTQYMAASSYGATIAALDAILEDVLTWSKEKGYRYVDFGHSNMENGQILNDSLYRFKVKFGAGGAVYETYTLKL